MLFGFFFLMSINSTLASYEQKLLRADHRIVSVDYNACPYHNHITKLESCERSSDGDLCMAKNGERETDVNLDNSAYDSVTPKHRVYQKTSIVPEDTLIPERTTKPAVAALSPSKTEESTNNVLSVGGIVAVTLLLFLLAGIIIARTKASQAQGVFGPILRCLDRRTVSAAIIISAVVVVSVVVMVVIVVLVVVVAVVVVVVAAAVMVVMPPTTQWPRFTLGQA